MAISDPAYRLARWRNHCAYPHVDCTDIVTNIQFWQRICYRSESARQWRLVVQKAQASFEWICFPVVSYGQSHCAWRPFGRETRKTSISLTRPVRGMEQILCNILHQCHVNWHFPGFPGNMLRIGLERAQSGVTAEHEHVSQMRYK